MDNSYSQAQLDHQNHPVYNGGHLKTPCITTRALSSAAYKLAHSVPTASPGTFSEGYDSQSYDFMCDFPSPSPTVEGCGELHLARRGHDSTASCPFGRPPSVIFSNMASAPIITYSTREASLFQTFSQQFRPVPQAAWNEPDSNQKYQHEYKDFSVSGPGGCSPFLQQEEDHETTARSEIDTALQMQQDQQWLRHYLQNRDKPSKISQTQQHCSKVPGLRRDLYRAAQLASRLVKFCDTLRSNVNNDCAWTDSYVTAFNLKEELQDKLTILDSGVLDGWKAKLCRVVNKGARRLRTRQLQQMNRKQREERISGNEAAIDKWRLRQIQQIEEKKKELELKLTADAVLCEVKKKQTDVRRMQDVLRSLEKLRRLRKEAASKKGIVTEKDCEEAFGSQLDQLRCLLKMRTAVYSVEEKALLVMLQGEQEERRREQEKQIKKESEKSLHWKRKVNTVLFGDDLPADSVPQPFTVYYTQAECSLHALLQTRREWDMFVVAVDHPDSSPVPQSWILPDAPSDQIWASALHTADPE